MSVFEERNEQDNVKDCFDKKFKHFNLRERRINSKFLRKSLVYFYSIS